MKPLWNLVSSRPYTSTLQSSSKCLNTIPQFIHTICNTCWRAASKCCSFSMDLRESRSAFDLMSSFSDCSCCLSADICCKSIWLVCWMELSSVEHLAHSLPGHSPVCDYAEERRGRNADLRSGSVVWRWKPGELEFWFVPWWFCLSPEWYPAALPPISVERFIINAKV